MVGCGDVGMRVARQLTAPGARVRLLAMTSSPERVPLLRAAGMTPLCANLDDPASLRRMSGLAQKVLHLAPPSQGRDGEGQHDRRTLALIRALRLRSTPQALVYGSTTGVYGDCQGALVSEERPVSPHTARAQRRVDAERLVRWYGRSGVRTTTMRIPGIYAQDREGGTPRERLLKGTPVLRFQEDVYTSHIHADDLARACLLALWRGRPQRVMNISDDSRMKMGDYFDLAADLMGLPRPRRISRADADRSLPLILLSFMSESRQLDNQRMKRELRLALRYPHVRDGLGVQGTLFGP